jgi:hypothetical protein
MTLRGRIKNVLTEAVDHYVQTKGGLLVPPTVVTGKHFGGFSGYAPWIQDCIAAACRHLRPGGRWEGVQPDELSEITAACLWAPPDRPTEPDGHVVVAAEDGGKPQVSVATGKHDDVMRGLEAYADAIRGDGLEGSFQAQVQRAQNQRALGSLLVVALDVSEYTSKGTVNASVSSWNAASIEEALAVPEQRYGRTYGS